MSNTQCSTHSLLPTQAIIEVIVTANDHNGLGYGCIDSLYFRTTDNQQFGCDARAGTTFTTTINRPTGQPSPYVFSIPSPGELADIYFPARSDCSIGWMNVYYKDPCALLDLSQILLDMASVNGKQQNIKIGAAEDISITASSACSNVQYSLLITPTTANLIALTTTSTPPKITFAASTNFADAGVYQITLQARFTGQITWTKSSGPVTYEYVNPCLTATITATPHPQFLVSVMTTVNSQPAIFFDSVSGSVASILCGPFTVTFTKPTTPATYVQSTMDSHFTVTTTSTQSILTVSPTLPAEIGDYGFQFTVCLTYYNTQCATFNSPFSITPCVVTGFTMNTLSPTNDKTYTVADNTMTWSLVAAGLTTQVPACGYTEQFSISAAPTFDLPATLQITATSPNIIFNLYSRNVANVGQHTIELTSTLQNYNPYSGATAPSASKTFTLTLVNSCQSTVITADPAQIENFVNFAGYSTKSLIQYAFNDTISLTNTLQSDTADFCGSKSISVSLNNTVSDWLSFKSQEYITFSPPKDTTQFGVAQGLVTIWMELEPSIKSLLLFSATVLGSVVPVIKDQSYLVGTSALLIQFEPFKVLPTDYDAGPSRVDTYILSQGSIIGTKVDLECACLTKIDDLSWITMDQNNRQLVVYSADNSILGEHELVLVQSFENFPDVLPFSRFKLTINVVINPALDKKLPPYFLPPLPEQIRLNQCTNTTIDQWTFNLPSIFDPNDSPVKVSVKLDFAYFKYDQVAQTIVQVQSATESVNKTIEFNLKNDLNFTAKFFLPVQFVCQAIVVVPSIVPKRNITQSLNKVQYPAVITSISRSGVVDIKFYKDVFVPNTTRPSDTHQKYKDYTRKLQEEQSIQCPEQFINKQVLLIKLKTQYTTQDLDWYCLNFTARALKLQINFTDPMSVSQSYQDQLLLTFNQTEDFVLSSGDEYLFSNQSVKNLTYNIPRQLPSQKTAEFFTTVTETVQQVGITVIVITFLIQIVAKKVITSMWLYYSSLQLILLLVMRSNMYAPSSVEVVINSVSGIINLSSFDKQQAASFIGLDSLKSSEVFQSLDGVALAAIGILIFIALCGLAIVITKRVPKLQQLLLRVKNMVFWNFLIRYFQASFIGFNFAAITNLQKTPSTQSDVITSSIILAFQYGVVCVIAYVLIKTSRWELNYPLVRERIGNLYFKLNTRYRVQILFGLMFFVQRSLLVMLVAIKYSFGIQWQVCQFVLQMNAIYIFSATPYKERSDATLDYINCCFIILACVFTATYSAWNPDTSSRLVFGIIFDCLVGLQFTVNLVFVAGQVVTALILKLKQFHYRWQQKKRQSALLKAKQAKLQEKSKEKSSDSVSNSVQQQSKKSRQQSNWANAARSKSTRQPQNQLITIIDEISERSEESEMSSYGSYGSSYGSYGSEESRQNESQLSAPIQIALELRQNNQLVQRQVTEVPWKARLVDDENPMFKSKESLEQYNLATAQLKQLLPQRKTQTTQLVGEKPNAQFCIYQQATQQSRNTPTIELTTQLQVAKLAGVTPSVQPNTKQVKPLGGFSAREQLAQYYSDLAQSMMMNDKNFNETNQTTQSISNLTQTKPVQQMKQTEQIFSQSQIEPQKMSYQSLVQEQQINNSKSQIEANDQNLQQKSMTNSTAQSAVSKVYKSSLAQAITRLEESAYWVNMTMEQKIQRQLDKAVRQYFSEANESVTRYGKEKVFSVYDDLLPYPLEIVLPYDPKRKTISKEEYQKQLRQYLTEQWKQTYPSMPFLPLFVTAEEYKIICNQISMEVISYCSTRDVKPLFKVPNLYQLQ